MIRFLSIQRLAVIDSVEIEFASGLNVLTGETGAGKSIVVGAVGLLLGGRASADLVRTGEESAIVQAVFETPEGEVIVRREVSAQGRSRAFIDGALVTSAALKDTCGAWVDLYGQHEHGVLLDPASHLTLLDRYAELDADGAGVAQRFEAWQHLDRALAAARADAHHRAAGLDLLTFQLAEIDRVAPVGQEDETLGSQRQVLANTERLQRLCAECYDALYEGESAVLGTLGGIWKRLGELAAVDPRFGPSIEARDVVKPQLEELAYFLRSYASAVESSPARLQEVEDRLAALERLKKKYGPTLDAVLARRAEMLSDRTALERTGERVGELEAALAAARARYLDAATALSARRRDAAGVFARRLETGLAELAMDRTRCEVRFQPGDSAADTARWTARGFDAVELYIAPNVGEELRPLARIASGGELSRIMLALKSMAAADAPGKTLIFDEVDAGIGGRIADVVGQRLRHLGVRFQVLSITHLPQVAAHATTHFTIAKQVRDGRTWTVVERLAPDDRAAELARMIGGVESGTSALAAAREMLALRGGACKAKGETSTKGESERAKAKGESETGRRGSSKRDSAAKPRA